MAGLYDSYIKPTFDFGKSAFKWVNDNADGIGAIGGIAGGVMKYDMAKKNFKLQKEAFNFNKMLANREKKRQKESEDSMAIAFKNSSLGSVV